MRRLVTIETQHGKILAAVLASVFVQMMDLDRCLPVRRSANLARAAMLAEQCAGLCSVLARHSFRSVIGRVPPLAKRFTRSSRLLVMPRFSLSGLYPVSLAEQPRQRAPLRIALLAKTSPHSVLATFPHSPAIVRSAIGTRRKSCLCRTAAAPASVSQAAKCLAHSVLMNAVDPRCFSFASGF